MKVILSICLLFAGTMMAEAQTPAKTTKTYVRPSARVQRGSGISHGSKDTTPGSPMGTGGAGGQEMSGSPAGSAIETGDQTEQAKAHPTKRRVTVRKKTTGKKVATSSSENATPLQDLSRNNS